VKPSQFVNFLVDDLKFRKTSTQADNWRDYSVVRLDVTALHLSLGPSTPVMVDERFNEDRILTETECDHLDNEVRDYLQEKRRRFCIVVVSGRIPSEYKVLQPAEMPKEYALLDSDHQAELIKLKDQAKRYALLGSILASQVGVLKLSPYAVEEPAEGGRFFGRTQLMREIIAPIATRCFLLIGPRRIGKTSLLLEIKRHLKSKQPDVDKLRIAHVVGSEFRSTAEVVAQIVSELEEHHPDKKAYQFGTREAKFRSLPQYIRKTTRSGKRKVAIFIDEVDKILQFDELQNYECLELLRSVVLQGQEHHDDNSSDAEPDVRIYMAGFRNAFRARYDVRTPLYGFAEMKEIPPLITRESHDMIVRPFVNLGLNLPDSLVEAIQQESGGHPQLISVLCKAVLSFVDRNSRAPTEAEFQPEILHSGDFERRLVLAYLSNTNVFETLVCLLLIKRASKLQRRGEALTNFEFGFQSIQEVLREVSINLSHTAVVTICHNLRLCSIITEVAGRSGKEHRFRFFIPQLMKVIAARHLGATLKETLEEARRRQRDWTLAFEEADVSSAERLYPEESAHRAAAT
jgi:hypothetical protein